MNSSLPDSTFLATSSSSPGSKIGILPTRSAAHLVSVLSTQQTFVRIRKARTGYQPDIAAADHDNTHWISWHDRRRECAPSLVEQLES